MNNLGYVRFLDKDITQSKMIRRHNEEENTSFH
jgi:hypothetical protein